MSAPTKLKDKFIDLVQAHHRLTSSQLERLMALDDIDEMAHMLVAENLVTEQEALACKGAVFGLPVMDVATKEVPLSVLHIVPQELAESYQMVALEQAGPLVTIGLVDATNLKAREAVEFLLRKLGLKAHFVLISDREWRQIVKQYEALKVEVAQALDVAKEEFQKADVGVDALDEVMKSAPVSKMVSVILKHAVEQRASDIHIEPILKGSRVRYRIDGMLKTLLELPQYIHPALVSRIKVMANLKIDETRRPQDGRIRQQFGDRTVDFRVSVLPLYDHEKVVLRVLGSSSETISLESLGFWGRNLELMKANIDKPHGLFLVTGPTGSGKSTTLYAVLNMLNQEDVNITTLEDPVEYYLTGVNQSQVYPEVGLTFATGLRSILRQDPDIVMVGEIRDNETAELAIHASLTGHFVMSTLHTNDALGAIPRLIDMRVEPYLLATTLNIAIAQRLVRKICEHCRSSQAVPADIMKRIKEALGGVRKELLPEHFDLAALETTYRGTGCEQCGDTGYLGRTTVSEVVDMTDPFRTVIAGGGEPQKLQQEFRAQGNLTMEQDGYIKALQGMTTLEEVMRVNKE